MTQIERIDANAFLVLSAMIRARPRHQRSIDAFFSRYMQSYERGFSKPVVIGLFRFLNRVLWLPDDLETEFDDKMNANEWERKREYVTSIERRGIKKGIAEIVSLQLQRRFGALNEAAQALVSALAVEQVRCERCAI